jgi:integrase
VQQQQALFTDVTTRLRRSELFALKWSDIDFSNLLLDVQRSIYLGKIGNCKTEASRKPVPLDERVAADIWLWKEASNYRQADDWIFVIAKRNPNARRLYSENALSTQDAGVVMDVKIEMLRFYCQQADLWGLCVLLNEHQAPDSILGPFPL